MKYLSQILIILAFTGVGELLSFVIPLPIPAAIYGLVLLFLALWTGFVKPTQVKEVSAFLISILTVFFVAPAVRILEYWGIIAADVAAIVTIAVTTTFLVFVVSALVTQCIMKKKGGKSHD